MADNLTEADKQFAAPQPTPEPLRLFAWVLVVVGIVIAIGYPIYVPLENERRDRAAEAVGWDLARQGFSYSRSERFAPLSPWPGVGVGTGTIAFGVLLLAIRRPKSD